MEVVVSAPGKVLITGGYLILERPNAGLVLSTNARFYAIVKPLYEEHNQKSWAWSWSDVKVSSPQLSREATYKLSLIKSVLQCTSSRDTENPFVEHALQFAVAAARSIIIEKGKKDALEKLLLQGLDITILGCNDFYSVSDSVTVVDACPALSRETLASFPPFSSIAFNVEDLHGAPSRNYKPEIAKTGLGSSAAMTTSVVAALLHYLGVVKVGSGFDISAAVYGSQCYVRFSPSVLSSAQVGENFLPDVVSDILKGNWDHEISRFSLPPLMNLLLGEPGTGGSSTPSMVGSVKQWQKADPENSLETWRILHSANAKLEAQLKLLSKFAEGVRGTYEHIINICSRFTHEKWMEQVVNKDEEAIVKALIKTRDAFIEIRSHMRHMGLAAGVPIEPESQTRLLDTTMNLEGVLLAGVPGAGGFDAVFAIILGQATDAVAKTWSSFGVLPLLVEEDSRGLCLESGDPRTRTLASAMSSIKIN
ncbi:hypothetical protein HPP92_020496 [Vanilla planifolia]|uniref:phosphomevalonate kinase n=1 Tax=Vanilla planifolia TaxID=51239 RepID=A0A835PX58_VANPL|nr:hypothetical protein HPP92_020496 [Vanilla planifolia]